MLGTVVVTSVAQDGCAALMAAHAPLYQACQLALPNVAPNLAAPATTLTAALCNSSCLAPANAPLVRQMINRGCLNSTSMAERTLNDVLSAALDFMCVRGGGEMFCLDALPVGSQDCSVVSGMNTSMCPNVTATLAAMGCCAGNFVASAHTFASAHLAATCLGNTLDTVEERVRLCRVAYTDPCGVTPPTAGSASPTSAPAIVAGGGASRRHRSGLSDDSIAAVAVVAMVVMLGFGAVVYFFRHKHIQDEEAARSAEMLLVGGNDVFAVHDDDD